MEVEAHEENRLGKVIAAAGQVRKTDKKPPGGNEWKVGENTMREGRGLRPVISAAVQRRWKWMKAVNQAG